MEKQTIHISPDMTPRRQSGSRDRSTENRRATERGAAERSGARRPAGGSGGDRPRRPLTEAERRRRIALRKKRKRQRMIRRMILLAAVVAMIVILLLLVVHLIRGKAEETKEPEMVEVEEFIGLADSDGNFANITEFGTYGAWLRLTGGFTPSPEKSVTGLTLELHNAYEKKLIPWEEAYPEEAARLAAEEEANKNFFQKLFSKEDEEETETETETEYETFLPNHSGVAVYPLDYATDEGGNVIFTTSQLINDGIPLDSMLLGDYTLLLHANYSDGTEERLTLADISGMAPIDYYTVTKGGANDEVTLSFQMDESGMPYLLYGKKAAALPENIYDIAIDAGHGGQDPGASNDQMTEAELTLIYAKGLAEKLTAMGYKVLLTRDGTESPSEDMAYTMYDENGRVNVACGSHAKLCVSIHFNSNKEVTKGGFEVYCSGRGNTELAGLIADTVVAEAGTTYSNQKSFKVRDGVYVKTLTEDDIASSNKKAANNGFEPYNLTTDTDTLFMIRELGGIWTNAYIDGRNPYYGTNLYHDSNAGVESYLIEAAFMSVPSDFQNAVTNAETFEQGIADAINIWASALSDGGYEAGASSVPAEELSAGAVPGETSDAVADEDAE